MIRINLLPPEYGAKQAKMEQLVIFGTFAGIICLIGVILLSIKKKQVSDLQSKITQAEDQLRTYQAINDQIVAIESNKQKLSQKRDVIKNLNNSRLVFPVFFEDLLPLIPSDVWLTDIRIESQSGNSIKYKLDPNALSNFALATWLTNLEQSTHFSGVQLSAISYSYPDGKEGQPVLGFQVGFSYQHQGPMPLTE